MAKTRHTNRLSQAAVSELQSIWEANNGILRAEDVVEHARNPESSLHTRFTWDDSSAAHKYRLWQARSIISIAVMPVEYKNEVVNVRIFGNLPSDRVLPGGGYRSMQDILSVAERRKEHLHTLRKEVVRLQAQYNTLQELQPAFMSFVQAIDDEIAYTNEVSVKG